MLSVSIYTNCLAIVFMAQLCCIHRHNMFVLFQDQYSFIYSAILEAVTVGDTTIPCYMFKEAYEELLKESPYSSTTPMFEQFRVKDNIHLAMGFKINIFSVLKFKKNERTGLIAENMWSIILSSKTCCLCNII